MNNIDPLSVTGGTPFNNGSPLTPQQVQDAQASLGIGNKTNSTSSQTNMSVAQRLASIGINADGTPISQPNTQTGTQGEPQQGNRNIVQNAAGAFLDPLAKLTYEGTTTGVEGILKGVNAMTEGGVDRYLQSKGQYQNLDDFISKYNQKSNTIPGLGTTVNNDATPEQVGGQALGTVGMLTGNPLVGGASLGAGSAMEKNSGVGGVVADAALWAIGGKLVEGALKLSTPLLSKLIDKYGQPVVDKMLGMLPESVTKGIGAVSDKLGSAMTTAADKTGLTKLGEVASNIDKGISGKIKEKFAGTPEQQSQKELSKIEEQIAPKLTSKEKKLAMSEGRVVEHPEGIITKGKPPEIIGSNKVMKNAPIIRDNIPGFAKMQPSQQADELKMKIGGVAEDLKPQMKEVPVKGKTIIKMHTDWENLKETQSQEPEFLDNKSGNKAFQKQFETRLNTVSSDSNLNDVWEAVKSFDKSMPHTTTDATSISNEVSQYRKNMWLENRRILRSAIDDTAEGLNGAAKKAFQDMSAMLDARNNIISKTKINLEGNPSKLTQLIKKNPIKSAAVGAAATGVLGAGAYNTIKKIGVPLP